MTLKEFVNKISYFMLGGALWKLGGTYGGWYRRLGVPFVFGLVCYERTLNIWASLITMVLGFLLVPTGYGINAPITKFWEWVLDDEKWIKRLTRFCVGICYSLVYIPKVAITQSMFSFASLVLLPFAIAIIVEFDTQDNEEVLIGAVYLGLYSI